MQFSVPLKKGHARNASPLLLQAYTGASQASGENRASKRTTIGKKRAADVARATPSSRRRVDGVAKDAVAATSPRNENNYTYREKASSAGASSCSAWADGDISIARYVSQK